MTRKFNLYRSIDLGFHIKNECNAIYLCKNAFLEKCIHQRRCDIVLVTLNHAYAAHPRESS